MKTISKITIATLASLALAEQSQAVPIFRQENPEVQLKKAFIYACSHGRFFAYSSKDYTPLHLQRNGKLKEREQTRNHPEYGTNIVINKTRKSFFGQPDEIIHEGLIAFKVPGPNGDLVPWKQVNLTRFRPKSGKIDWTLTTYEAQEKGGKLEVIRRDMGSDYCKIANYPFKPKPKEFGEYLLQTEDFKQPGVRFKFQYLSNCTEKSSWEHRPWRNFGCTSGFLVKESPLGKKVCEINEVSWTREWSIKDRMKPLQDYTSQRLDEGECRVQ